MQTKDPVQYANSFIIGAAKSATTTIFSILKNHPQVSFCQPKEPCFFAIDQEYEKGLEHYSSLFKPTKTSKVILDGSTAYSRCTVFPNAAQRIYEAVPEAKLIYLMRHPVDRAFAHYKHRWLVELHRGQPFTETFEEFVKHDKMCIDDSLYKLQAEAYLKYFAQEQLLFCFTEDLQKTPLDLVTRVCDHLQIGNITPSELKTNENSKVRDRIIKNKIRSSSWVKSLRYLTTPELREWLYDNIISKTSIVKKAEQSFTPVPMKTETRRELIEYYSETVAWVEQITQRKLPHWYK
ncbi:sulfotransferase [Gloeocapsa sp. PCC 73106]|uniref:sulfotransferase family protein n=1 Tax=Gloeocapsa sp. PCC 73106 TaxID=102232 RepID=UPI0002AC6C25|nr:sulfotransferase [Gloeocapsa sp. PCC 73106]ELR97665.1 sulfotransferase family protein [Gloeocapsa sp. PCC 73106]